jgi:predicted phosphoadenosine phosphosulfate sulfurtransferase
MDCLLSTLPEQAKANYLEKVETSRKFWKNSGGVLSDLVQAKLRDRGILFSVSAKTGRKTDKLPVRMEYLDDIDIEEFQQIPTYKRVCICILKNDHLCKYMGFDLTKRERDIRENAIKKYKTH